MALAVRAAQMNGVLTCQCSRRGQVHPGPTRNQPPTKDNRVRDNRAKGNSRRTMAGPNRVSFRNSSHSNNSRRTASRPVTTLRSNHLRPPMGNRTTVINSTASSRQ